MSQDWASVIPFLDWAPGYANVLPMPPGPTDMPTVIPQEIETTPSVTVIRSDHPMGKVAIHQDHALGTPSAELPLIWVTGPSSNPIDIGPGTSRPNGVVVLFRGT